MPNFIWCKPLKTILWYSKLYFFFYSFQFYVKKKRTFIILQNGEQAYVFQQNTPFHSATWRKQYLRRKATGMRAPNKISDMKSNDNNLELQQTKGKFYTETKFYNSFRSLWWSAACDARKVSFFIVPQIQGNSLQGSWKKVRAEHKTYATEI